MSSVRSCTLLMVICLPTPTTAGTVITNFIGRQSMIEGFGCRMVHKMLAEHAMGSQAMSCVWVLAMSLLRTILTAPLEDVSTIFDPLTRGTFEIPQLAELPRLLKQSHELVTIDRYASRLSEMLAFFDSVKAFQQKQHVGSTGDGYSIVSTRSSLESELTRNKITHVQQLCKTYTRQHESLLQMMMSHSATKIATRLDGGQRLVERLTVIGLVLASTSVITAPLSILTAYYGMNVKEFVEGSTLTLFGFWQIAIPIIALSTAGVFFIITRALIRDA
ncbi:hypothetical protein GGR57DRAFT_447415 [Xylariaceae sp. FL1272]|nr:hypothetical protein GGR57DRAFT_447415 [Xylariaceae sp. FL1272]